MGITEVLAGRREAVLALAARHGARNVRVFGSVARGDARPDSDIDFLVEVSDSPSAFFPAGLILDVQELLGRRVDVVTDRSLHALVRDRVLQEALPL